MSTYDSLFESNAITLLKGIYDNIGSTAYKTISGKVQQDEFGVTSVDIIFNDSDYTLGVDGFPGIVQFSITGGAVASDIRSAQLFIGPSQHAQVTFTNTIIQNSDIIITVTAWNSDVASPSPDSRGFGSATGNPVDFEFKFYTLP